MSVGEDRAYRLIEVLEHEQIRCKTIILFNVTTFVLNDRFNTRAKRFATLHNKVLRHLSPCLLDGILERVDV